MPIMNQKEPNKHKMPEVQTFTFDSERNDWASPWVNFYDSILYFARLIKITFLINSEGIYPSASLKI